MSVCAWAGCHDLATERVGEWPLCAAHLAEDAALSRDDDTFRYPVLGRLPRRRQADVGLAELHQWMVANGWLVSRSTA